MVMGFDGAPRVRFAVKTGVKLKGKAETARIEWGIAVAVEQRREMRGRESWRNVVACIFARSGWVLLVMCKTVYE